MGTNISEDDIYELSNKLDALLGLVYFLGKKGHSLWSTDWVIEFLLQFNLSEKLIKAVTAAGEDEIRRARVRTKERKLRKPSFLDHFREE